MDMAFFHEAPARGRRRLIVPVRRALRRVLRPYLVHLQGLLALHSRSLADHQRLIREQQEQIHRLEVAHADLKHRFKVGATDHLAVARRLARLEELLTADHSGEYSAEGLEDSHEMPANPKSGPAPRLFRVA